MAKRGKNDTAHAFSANPGFETAPGRPLASTTFDKSSF